MDVTFSDNASNTGTTACKLDVLYRFDNTAPYLKHLTDDKQKDDLAQKKPTDVQGYYADDSITWKIVVADKMNDPTDRAGVSGIKYIDAEVKKTKDYLGNPNNKDPNCSKKENYGPQMKSSSGGLDKDEVTATLELTCNKDQTDIEVAGTYEIHISFEDHAGNKGNKEVRTIQIVPNPDKLEIDWNRSTQPSTSTPKNTVYANASDHYAYQPKLRDVYKNVVHGKSPTLSLTGGIFIYMDSMTNT